MNYHLLPSRSAGVVAVLEDHGPGCGVHSKVGRDPQYLHIRRAFGEKQFGLFHVRGHRFAIHRNGEVGRPEACLPERLRMQQAVRSLRIDAGVDAPLLEELKRRDLRQVQHVTDGKAARPGHNARVAVDAEISHRMAGRGGGAQHQDGNQSLCHLTGVRAAVREWIHKRSDAAKDSDRSALRRAS